jgi:N-acetylneuraminic acid mutarotase
MQHKLKGLLLITALLISACNSGGGSSTPAPLTSGWNWINGSNQSESYGVYGTRGVASNSNIPGARDIAISWVGASGDFWLFGGSGYAASGTSGNLNDLWKYSPATNQWTWMKGANTTNAYGEYGVKGVAADSNQPGARLGAVSWKTSNGSLWMFGGFGNAAVGVPGALNDLWKYTPETNQWTWVDGSKIVNTTGSYISKGVAGNGNMPGARLGAVGWTDKDGNLWLFGGAQDISTLNVFNDLWKYDPSTNQWTWVSGEQALNLPGVYGIQGVISSTNQPGARLDSISWVESSGKLWLFGGSGIDASGNRGKLNDLWVYNPNTNEWKWASGSNQKNAYGMYGTLGSASQNSIPGAREHRIPISWSDNLGNLWMFGGDGYGASTSGLLNDLWSYNPKTNQWMWVSGASESNTIGNYGGQGILSATNQPGARKDAIGWVESTGKLWLFGGSGNAANSSGYLNDLWQYSY